MTKLRNSVKLDNNSPFASVWSDSWNLDNWVSKIISLFCNGLWRHYFSHYRCIKDSSARNRRMRCEWLEDTCWHNARTLLLFWNLHTHLYLQICNREFSPSISVLVWCTGLDEDGETAKVGCVLFFNGFSQSRSVLF